MLRFIPLALLLPAITACGGDTFTVAGQGGGGGSGTDTGGTSAGGTTSSGGTVSSGGSNASGGAGPGTGGSGTSGSGGSASCVDGMLNIKVSVTNAMTTALYCSDQCGGSPVTITDEFGKVVRTTTSCETSCSSCGPVLCPAAPCIAPVPMIEPYMMTWDGSQYPQSTCGAAVTCYEDGCTKPGTYVVKACLPMAKSGTSTSDLSCTSTGEFDCKQKEISWPTTTSVILEF